MRPPMTLLAAVTMIAGTAFAQPAKHDLPRPSPPSVKRAAVVVLASADTAHAAPPVLPQPVTESKRPAPRITHCRCGDPQPGDATPDE